MRKRPRETVTLGDVLAVLPAGEAKRHALTLDEVKEALATGRQERLAAEARSRPVCKADPAPVEPVDAPPAVGETPQVWPRPSDRSKPKPTKS